MGNISHSLLSSSLCNYQVLHEEDTLLFATKIKAPGFLTCYNIFNYVDPLVVILFLVDYFLTSDIVTSGMAYMQSAVHSRMAASGH